MKTTTLSVLVALGSALCKPEGGYCFVDTYNHPEKGVIAGCNGIWSGLAFHYQTELDKEWEERVKKEKASGKFSLIVERWLRKDGKLLKGYDDVSGSEAEVDEKESQVVEMKASGEKQSDASQRSIELGTGGGAMSDESDAVMEKHEAEASSSWVEM